MVRLRTFAANNCAAPVTKGDSGTSFWVRSFENRVSDETDPYIEFDFRVLGDGRSASARYANNSNYRNDSLIRKESKKPKIGNSVMSLTLSSVRERCSGR